MYYSRIVVFWYQQIMTLRSFDGC